MGEVFIFDGETENGGNWQLRNILFHVERDFIYEGMWLSGRSFLCRLLLPFACFRFKGLRGLVDLLIWICNVGREEGLTIYANLILHTFFEYLKFFFLYSHLFVFLLLRQTRQNVFYIVQRHLSIKYLFTLLILVYPVLIDLGHFLLRKFGLICIMIDGAVTEWEGLEFRRLMV